MKTISLPRSSSPLARAAAAAALASALWTPTPRALAYPPAPYHLIYGLVRDEYGTPFSGSEAQIILQTTNGVQLAGTVVPGLIVGVNYQIEIPMDSGLTADTYSPTALKSATPFRIYVVTAATTN